MSGRAASLPALENQVLATAISLVASASSSTLDRDNFILAVKMRYLWYMYDVEV